MINGYHSSVNSSMEFELGCLEEIPDDKLKELSAALAVRIKEAKKKVASLIEKDKALMSMYVSSIGIDSPKAMPEELTEIRNKRKKDFEMALLANPDAFVAYQVKTFLLKMNDEIRHERIRRAPVKESK